MLPIETARPRVLNVSRACTLEDSRAYKMHRLLTAYFGGSDPPLVITREKEVEATVEEKVHLRKLPHRFREN